MISPVIIEHQTQPIREAIAILAEEFASLHEGSDALEDARFLIQMLYDEVENLEAALDRLRGQVPDESDARAVVVSARALLPLTRLPGGEDLAPALKMFRWADQSGDADDRQLSASFAVRRAAQLAEGRDDTLGASIQKMVTPKVLRSANRLLA